MILFFCKSLYLCSLLLLLLLLLLFSVCAIKFGISFFQ